MIEDKPIDLKIENRRLGNELSLLRQKNEELKEDRDYIKSLLDVEFEKRIKLSKENEQLKSRIKELEIMNKAQSDAIDGLQETMCHFDLGDVE